MSFSPDGRTLASGSHDKTMKVWDVSTGNQITSVVHPSEVCDKLDVFYDEKGHN